MQYDIGGCKLVIKDKTNKEEILNAMATFLTKLEEEQGIEEFSNINVYFQIYKDEEKQILVNKDNLEKTYNGFSFKINCEGPHKKIEQLEDGSKKITFNKDVNWDRINNSIEKVRGEKDNDSKIVTISITKYERILNAYRVEQLEQQQKAMAERQTIRDAKLKKEQEEKDHLRLFKEIMAKRLNIELKDLSSITTSVTCIYDKNSIEKYITLDKLPIEGKVFRITFKNKVTKKATHTEVYNMQFELIQ